MRNFFFIVLLLILSPKIYAQYGFVTTGGDAVGTGGSVCFSFSQSFYHSVVSEGGIISEGLQQPYEIYVITSIPEMEHINLLYTVYPNPVSDNLTLIILDEPDVPLNFSFMLYNMTGKRMSNGEVKSSHTSISTSELLPGTYLLRVMDKHQELKTFKIIKY